MLTLTNNWSVLFLRGVIAILFAVCALAKPGLSLAALILLFGGYTFVDGVLHLIAAFRSGGGNWWALMLAGIFGIGAGVVMFSYPGLTALSLLYYIGFWSIASGVAEIIAAVRLRKEIEGEWRLALAGLLAVMFGIFFVVAPGAGALGLLMVIAVYAFGTGVVLILLGFKLRALGKR